MPLFRGKRRKSAQEEWADEVPDDLEIPEGMAAVPLSKLDEWANEVATAASEKATSPRTPEFVDLYSKVALPDICGREHAATLSGGAGLLAYNLRLHGYWCRAEEMRILRNQEPSPSMTHLLTEIHDRHGITWFEVMQRAAHQFSDLSPEERDQTEALPTDMGDDFRRRLAIVCIQRMAAAVDEQQPGSSSALTSDELYRCWSTGYWLRATSVSLPDAAHAEFAADAASEA